MLKFKDRFLIGLISGLLAPPVAFAVFSLLSFPDRSILGTLRFYMKGNVLSHVISLSVLMNLIVFFFFLNSKKEQTARGVIGATFVYVFIVLIVILLS
ncbi:MAG: hypothetical protein IPP51_11590 [Bacteroidetes bacterium]|nr:hypothetical protein [Bacteroidota bacterium]